MECARQSWRAEDGINGRSIAAVAPGCAGRSGISAVRRKAAAGIGQGTGRRTKGLQGRYQGLHRADTCSAAGGAAECAASSTASAELYAGRAEITIR